MARRGDKRKDGWMDRKSPHSTELCPQSGPLPCFHPMETNKISFWNKRRAEQGNRWPFDAIRTLVTRQDPPQLVAAYKVLLWMRVVIILNMNVFLLCLHTLLPVSFIPNSFSDIIKPRLKYSFHAKLVPPARCTKSSLLLDIFMQNHCYFVVFIKCKCFCSVPR